MLNRIISVKQQYFKLFNCVPKLNYWYYITILGTIWLSLNNELCWIEWLVLDSNTVCKHMINIEDSLLVLDSNSWNYLTV